MAHMQLPHHSRFKKLLALVGVMLAILMLCSVAKFFLFYFSNDCDENTRWYYAFGSSQSIPLPPDLVMLGRFSGAASGGLWTGHIFLTKQHLSDVAQFFSDNNIPCAERIDETRTRRWGCYGQAIPFGNVEVQIEPVSVYTREHLYLEGAEQAFLETHPQHLTIVIITYHQCNTI
jgi:hypothetical protein